MYQRALKNADQLTYKAYTCEISLKKQILKTFLEDNSEIYIKRL